MLTQLIPLVVVGPMAIAAALLALAHVLPRYVPDVIAIATALGLSLFCALLGAYALHHGPLTYWFGGWTPGRGVVLGIGFGVDPASAALAAFVGLLFADAFVFAWGYFNEVHAHFHVLMLLFLAAMVGFCLTRDLFNLFVWFEVMSVAAFALTAYQLETPSLAGALNFTVTNSVAAFMMLGGVGLIYARAGVLDFEALGKVAAGGGHDPVIAGAFCLLAGALMIKGAILPFHFWLSDAHAVAPSPVSVIFSGAMVSVGLFALLKLALQVFGASADSRFLMHGLFIGLGCATAVVGGLMAWTQRHLKRMLAFSTIAHLGIMLIALATLSATGVAGFLFYAVGHGLVKGALFMIMGILLATKASVDELDLKGLGKDIWPAGVAMGVGGLLLGGGPLGALDTGTRLVHAAAMSIGPLATAAIVLGSALTGAAVLRATGRIFLNLGPDPGQEAEAPSQKDQEKADRPVWLMLAPCLLLLLLAVLPVDGTKLIVARMAGLLASPASAGGAPPLPAASLVLPCLSVGLAIIIALLALFQERLPRLLVGAMGRGTKSIFRGLNALHSGLVGDYVVWIVIGLATFSIAFAFH